MRGEAIEAVKNGMQVLISALKQDPYALETAYISITTFDRIVQNVLPLTEIGEVIMPELVTPESGPTHLGAALEDLCSQYDRDIVLGTAKQKGDWMPLLFIITDGGPSDMYLYRQMIGEVRRRKFANIIALGAGPKAKEQYLRELTDNVTMLDTVEGPMLQHCFKWVSATVSSSSRSSGVSSSLPLPPPPPEVHLMI